MHFFVYDILKILFLLFTIIIVISYFRSYIDSKKLKKFIEKQPKILAHLFASIFGAITPFCSCSSIPVFIGFTEAGIPFGVGMSFLITSPMINEIAILVLAGIVGWKITTIYIITGIATGILGGIIMQKFGWGKYLQDYLHKKTTKDKKTCCSCSCTKIKNKISSQKEKIQESFIYASNLIKKDMAFCTIRGYYWCVFTWICSTRIFY